MARPHGRRPSEKHPARSWPAPARRCGGCRLSAGGAGARQTCPVQQTAVRQRVVAHGAAALHSKECLQPERPMTATDPPAAAAWRPGPPHHGRRGHGHRPGLRADAKAGPHPTAAAARQPGQLWRLRRPRPEGRLPDAQRRTRPRVRPRPLFFACITSSAALAIRAFASHARPPIMARHTYVILKWHEGEGNKACAQGAFLLSCNNSSSFIPASPAPGLQCSRR